MTCPAVNRGTLVICFAYRNKLKKLILQASVADLQLVDQQSHAKQNVHDGTADSKFYYPITGLHGPNEIKVFFLQKDQVFRAAWRFNLLGLAARSFLRHPLPALRLPLSSEKLVMTNRCQIKLQIQPHHL